MNTKSKLLRGLLCFTLITCTASPSFAIFDKIFGSGGTKTEDGDAKLGLPDYKGIKHAVGVKDFDNDAGWKGRWELGRNLSTMLESALYDSGRFVMVERENLGTVIQEQDLMKSGRMAPGKAVAQTGKLRAARYIATGAIVEVEDNTSGDSGGIRIKGISVGASGGKATITAIVKLVDTTTGEIVAKKRIVGKAGRRGLKVGYSGAEWGGKLGGFAKEPIGQAAQDVINEAVKFLATEMEDYKLDGSVIKVSSSGKVIINRGTQYGVGVGMEFVVATEGEELIDPESGEVLDKEEGEIISRIKVTKVSEKVAYCELVDGEKPEKGQVVTTP